MYGRFPSVTQAQNRRTKPIRDGPDRTPLRAEERTDVDAILADLADTVNHELPEVPHDSTKREAETL